jgi:hypothetical protein
MWPIMAECAEQIPLLMYYLVLRRWGQRFVDFVWRIYEEQEQNKLKFTQPLSPVLIQALFRGFSIHSHHLVHLLQQR